MIKLQRLDWRPTLGCMIPTILEDFTQPGLHPSSFLECYFYLRSVAWVGTASRGLVGSAVHVEQLQDVVLAIADHAWKKRYIRVYGCQEHRDTGAHGVQSNKQHIEKSHFQMFSLLCCCFWWVSANVPYFHLDFQRGQFTLDVGVKGENGSYQRSLLCQQIVVNEEEDETKRLPNWDKGLP